MSFSLFRL
ncbi:hypothetical protein EC5412_2729, partial [Escherichia coli 5412]